MDWFADRADERVGRFVESYAEAFREELRERRDRVWGIGGWLTPQGPAPIALIDAYLLRNPERLRGTPVFSVDEVKEMRIGELPGWLLEARPLLLPVARPEPLAAGSGASTTVGNAIRCPATTFVGTVGWPVTIRSGGLGFLTAGHVANGVGDVIEEITKGSFFRSNHYTQLGTVAAHNDPIGTPGHAGYDVAVVDCGGLVAAPSSKPGIAQLVAPVSQPLPVTLNGAASGTVHGAIVGALAALGDSARLWENCWAVVPSGLVAQRDSGAILVDDGSNELVGMLVGASRLPGGSAYAVQYAHDLDSIERNVLRGHGVALA
jgi:hypothetical protein